MYIFYVMTYIIDLMKTCSLTILILFSLEE